MKLKYKKMAKTRFKMFYLISLLNIENTSKRKQVSLKMSFG